MSNAGEVRTIIPANLSSGGAESNDFLIESRRGFDLNFIITAVAGYKPRTAEALYLARIPECIARLADVPNLGSEKANPDILEQEVSVRDQGVRALRRRADAFVKLPRGDSRESKANEEIIETYRIEGRYREWSLRISTIPFTVKTEARQDNPNKFYDLNISTRDIHSERERLI